MVSRSLPVVDLLDLHFLASTSANRIAVVQNALRLQKMAPTDADRDRRVVGLLLALLRGEDGAVLRVGAIRSGAPSRRGQGGDARGYHCDDDAGATQWPSHVRISRHGDPPLDSEETVRPPGPSHSAGTLRLFNRSRCQQTAPVQ
jgi:hypothetical protein